MLKLWWVIVDRKVANAIAIGANILCYTEFDVKRCIKTSYLNTILAYKVHKSLLLTLWRVKKAMLAVLTSDLY